MGSRRRPDSVLYLYAIVRADAELPKVPGVDGRGGVFLVKAQGLAGVVSQVARALWGSEALGELVKRPTALARLARAHEAVVEALMETSPVLPARLATIYETEAEVLNMLLRNGKPLNEGLEFVDQKEEWGVKIYRDPEILRSFLRRSFPTLRTIARQKKAAQRGEHFLLKKQEELLLAQKVGDRSREAVRTVEMGLGSIASRVAWPEYACEMVKKEASEDHRELVSHVAFLISRRERERFLETTFSLARQLEKKGFSLVPSGPWPPYNFVQEFSVR